MKRIITLTAIAALIINPANRSTAVELLVSSNFESPGGLGDIPGWNLLETLTGSSESVDTGELVGDDTNRQIFFKAFAGGGPLTPRQGNFDNDNLPVGDVDGRDFLIWQRNFGRTDAEPTDGDANEDKIVDGTDLGIWKGNYGVNNAGRYTNARLMQTVPATAGQTYNFQGTSLFEHNYSGFVTTLGDASPNGQIVSPTVTQFRMEFLNSAGNVIGSPATLDLRTEQTLGDFPVVHSPLSAVAPAGTFNVRVVAEALNMAWNGNTTDESVGSLQSAFVDDFSLYTTANPGTNLLFNGDLNLNTPDALDFWNQVEVPATNSNILRAGPGQTFSNHTPGGSRGVWLSGFLGAHSNFEPTPVDGIISQTVEAVEGGNYTFSGWTKFEGGFSGGVDTICTGVGCTGLYAGQPSPTQTFITIEFFDAGGPENGTLLGSSTIDIKLARRDAEDLADDGVLNGTGDANDNVWRESSLSAVAPTGTRFIKLSAGMLDAVFNRDVGGSLGNQSAFFDDFSLDGPAPTLLANVSVPEPSSLVMLGVGTLLFIPGRNRK